MIILKWVGSVCSDLLGSICSGQLGSLSAGQVGSVSLNFTVKERKFNDALEYLSKAIELDPNNALIYNEKGKCYSHILCCQRLGYKYKEALENFLIAYKLNPKDIQTIINIGHTKIGLKEYEEAIEVFSKVLKKDKFNIEALTNRAFAKMMTRDHQGVKKDTAKVFQTVPDNAYCLYIYGTSLIGQRNLAEGVHYLQRSANLGFDLAINSLNRLAPIIGINKIVRT